MARKFTSMEWEYTIFVQIIISNSFVKFPDWFWLTFCFFARMSDVLKTRQKHSMHRSHSKNLVKIVVKSF